MSKGFYQAVRPALFLVPPEAAHRAALRALKCGLLPVCRDAACDDPLMKTTLWNKSFPNPVGIAAGFDKNGEVPLPLLRSGFGFAETGTVTPKPQSGNPAPRLFRCPEHGALINRMGFPNAGLRIFKRNLERALSQKPRPPGLIGINIGMNKNTPDQVRDYCMLVRALAPMADFLTVNISSPNTPGLRSLQSREKLAPLLDALLKEREKSCPTYKPPVLVKLSPDMEEDQQTHIAPILLDSGIDGMILCNTSLARPGGLPERFAAQPGGLSGRPVREMSTRMIRTMYACTQGKIPIIGTGGITTGRDAYEKIRAGASLVQIYTAYIYRGPAVAGNICRELAACLRADGFARVSQAVGADARA